jgi:chromate transporter
MPTSQCTPPAAITFWQALRFWFKLGFISFGGPAGQISIMHQELVEQRRWISEKRFLHALNYCMVLPGPEAQQLATYIGWLMHRRIGGVVAGMLFVLPSLLILIALSWLYIAFGHVTLVAGLLYGIKPAVLAIVLQAAHRIGIRALKNTFLWGIALAAFLAIFIGQIAFPLIVLSAAGLGFLGGKWWPAFFQTANPHNSRNSPQKKQQAAVIDDDSEIPAHARFSWYRLCQVLLAGALLWLAPMVILFFGLGWSHPLTQMAWFFTKAALLTFGGAYAVLPYVYQGAVVQYQWLSASQMIDGLALGETTPGPLIMVVAFVGFVGAYVKQIFGAEHLFLAGAAAACLVTWFTFLPSFIFILAGGPLIESTHNDLKFTAPLTAITAAIVGVIVSLALFFAYHVLWPQGFGADLITQIDWRAALISVAAAIALFIYKRNVIHVIAVCALLGFINAFFHH